MDIDVLILSFICIFMLHNLEEVFMIERWFNKNYPLIRKRIPSFVQKEFKEFEDITSAQFAVVVFVLSFAASVLVLLTVITEHYFLFLGLHLFFALNILIHPLQAVYLRCYVPGLWTTLILIIPYNIMFFYHFSTSGLLTKNTILGSLVVMFLLIPVFLLSHNIGEKWS